MEADVYSVYAAPFAVFMSFTLLLQFGRPLVGWEHPSAAWWQRAPEQLIYPLQTFAAGWCVWHIRRRVHWAWSWRGTLLGVIAGVAGIAFWLVPAACTLYWPGNFLARPDLLEGGFDPVSVFGAENRLLIVLCYALRIIRAVIVVACVEELFWRGFLMRFLIDREHPDRVPIGTPGFLSWAGTTLCFMLVHTPADYPAALVYGSIAWLLVVKTRSIGAAVAMHAAANLVLCLAALCFGLRGLL